MVTDFNTLLSQYDRLVKEDGTPTDFFMRLLQTRQNLITDFQSAIDAILAGNIIAGAGLDGGGSLANGDVTLDANASDILDLISNVRGTVLYRGAAGWAALAPGTSGQFLKTNGAGADPAWAAAGGGSGRATPTLVQAVATLRNDGTIALGAAPTVGNLMVFVSAGWSGSLSAYAPAGFSFAGSYSSNSNNSVMVWVRRVVGGDTGSYAVSASDNQAACLYEYADAFGVVPIMGGNLGVLSSTTWRFSCPPSAYQSNYVNLLAVEQDTTSTMAFTAMTGLTQDFATTGATNHTGLFGRVDGATVADFFVNGTSSAALTAPVFGVFTVIGS